MRARRSARRLAVALSFLSVALVCDAILAPGGLAAAAAPSQIVIHDYTFVPAEMTVQRGTTVTWINQDSDAHTITSNPGPERFASPGLGPGDRFTFTFRKAGTYRYTCSLHPFMHGTIVVR
jgi:plastocyanin